MFSYFSNNKYGDILENTFLIIKIQRRFRKKLKNKYIKELNIYFYKDISNIIYSYLEIKIKKNIPSKEDYNTFHYNQFQIYFWKLLYNKYLNNSN